MLAIASVSFVSCSTSSSTPGPSQEARSAALRKALDGLVSMPGGPPGALAVVQAGSGVQTVATGKGDVATGAPMAADQTVRLASVSKAFSGAVALSLVDQKVLSLSDTIGRLLPDLPPAWASVTLAEALHHTSGLPDYIKNQAFLSALQANPQMVLTPEQLLGYVSTEPLAFTPGSRYDYSDSDNIVVGLMVQAGTAKDYASELAQQVTTPLQLSHTTLPVNADLPEPYVRGYDIEPGQPPQDVSMAINPGLAWASGGMNSTPAELNQFMRAYVAGRLFGRSTQEDQRQFVAGSSGPPGPGDNSAGLGIFEYRTTCGTVLGHTGNIPGYTLFAAASADGSRSVVVIVNEQLNSSPASPAFTALRRAEGLAVCDALG